MKKWFATVCFSVISVAAFAQMDPHSTQEKQRVLTTHLENAFSSSLESAFSNKADKRMQELRDNAAAIERKVAQARAKAKTQANTQEQQPSWPHQDGITDAVESTPSSDRPSYYVTDEAYNNCNQVEVCKKWAQEQANKDIHFQVLSATISSPDLHNQRLEVRYSAGAEEEVKVFEQNFDGSWK